MLTKERQRRKRRNMDKVRGSENYPRLVVYRSNKYIYGQIIDDQNGKVLVAMSEKELKDVKGTKTERASLVGKELASKAKKNKINKVRFDRAGYRYHGRVKAVADGAREGGLEL
jgi:large subunit ribosomal protein L18